MNQDTKLDRPILRCTFCNKSEHEVHRLIASSPSITMCDGCIQLLSKVLKDNSDTVNMDQYEILRNETSAQPDESFWLFRRIRDSFNTDAIGCVFCHKSQFDVDRMIGKTPNYVCEECISAMINLLTQEESD